MGDDQTTVEKPLLYRVGRAIRDRDKAALGALGGKAIETFGTVVLICAVVWGLAAGVNWLDSEWATVKDVGFTVLIVVAIVIGGLIALALGLLALSMVTLAIALPISFAISLFWRRN